MTRLPALPVARLRRFLRDESGSATVEFAIFVPAFLYLFLACFESGLLLMRQVLLDRALDETVRHVRLGHFDTAADANGSYSRLHEELKATMCQALGNRPSCRSEMRLEMARVDPRNWAPGAAGAANCVDRADPAATPVLRFEPGASNELMILRACLPYDPFFPTWGIGQRLTAAKGYYAMLSTTAYVVEPRT